MPPIPRSHPLALGALLPNSTDHDLLLYLFIYF
jgi:hypothetical protein